MLGMRIGYLPGEVRVGVQSPLRRASVMREDLLRRPLLFVEADCTDSPVVLSGRIQVVLSDCPPRIQGRLDSSLRMASCHDGASWRMPIL